jgi:hypothetical protein
MSFQAMTWAIEQELQVKEKMVLLMLANYCNNHTGQCNPSLPTLAKECGMSKDSVIRAIKILESKKLVTPIRQKIGAVNLPNQYLLAVSDGTKQPVVAESDYPPSRSQRVGSSCVLPEPVIQPIKRTITTTTPPENSKNLELKLTAEQQACFDWAKENDYWHLTTTSTEEFLLVYNNPKGGMRKQFNAYKKSPNPINGGNHAAHQQASQKLSAGDRIRVANGIPLNDELTVIDSTATHVV